MEWIRDPNVNPHIYRYLMFLNRNQYYTMERRKTLSEQGGSSQSDLSHSIWTIQIWEICAAMHGMVASKPVLLPRTISVNAFSCSLVLWLMSIVPGTTKGHRDAQGLDLNLWLWCCLGTMLLSRHKNLGDQHCYMRPCYYLVPGCCHGAFEGMSV